MIDHPSDPGKSRSEPETTEEAKLVFSEDHGNHRNAEFPDLCVCCAEENGLVWQEGQALCTLCSVLLTSAEDEDDGCCDQGFCSSCVWTHQEEEHPMSNEELRQIAELDVSA